jgi:hypothetical protein
MGVKTKLRTSSPRLLNSWLSVVTILIIVLAIFFYSLVYVRNNEKEQTAKGFRVLAQIGNNIVEREKGFKKIAENIDREQKDLQLADLERKLKDAKPVLKMTDKKPVQGSTRFLVFKEITVGKNRATGAAGAVYYIYADPGEFFKPLERSDVFDQLIVLADKEPPDIPPVKDDEETGSLVVYHTFPGEVDISDLGKLKHFEQGLESGSLTEIEISNRKYKFFLQPIRLGDAGKWYVGGLVPVQKFNNEARNLKANVVILLFFIFFIFLFSIPPLKLFLMSTFERLDIKDAFSVAVSIMFGMISLVLLYIYVYQSNRGDSHIDENLGRLCRDIETKFVNELEAAYDQLDLYETTFQDRVLEPGTNIRNILTNPQVKGMEDDLRPSLYDQFKVVFWMDENGNQVAQLSTRNYGGSLVPLGHRAYFRDAGNWRLPGKEGNPFMLESITSVTSGENLAAVSMKSRLKLKNDNEGKSTECRVAALTTQLTSLIDTVMPVGYRFCVIDESGEVWFHSDKERNHQENFIDETGSDAELVSAIHGRQERYIKLDYQGRTHRCVVIPVPNLPLFIVTFYDMRYDHSVRTYTFFYTIVFILLLEVFNVLLFLIVGWANYRSSFLERKYNPFDWLKPLKARPEIYRYLILSNFFLIVTAAAAGHFTRGAGSFLLSAFVCLLAFVNNYFMIARKEDKKPLPLIKKMLKRLRENRFTNRVNAFRAYLLFLLSWFVLIGVIPVLLFYIDAYEHENEIAVKLFQLKLAQRIEDRDLRIEKMFRERMDSPADNTPQKAFISTVKRERKDAGIYLPGKPGIAYVWRTVESNPERVEKPTFSHEIAYLLRPPLGPLSEEKKSLVFPAASDESLSWFNKDGSLFFRYRVKNSLDDREDTGKSGNGKIGKEYIYVRGDLEKCRLLSGVSLLLFIVVLFLALVCAYYLIRFAVRMIFGLKLLDFLEPLGEFDKRIRKHIRAGSDLIIYCQTAKQMDFCTGLFRETSEKDEKTDEKGRGGNEGEKNVIIIDRIIDLDLNLDSAEPVPEGFTGAGSVQIVLIKNFEFYFDDIDKSLQKMKRVKALLISQNVRVIIPAFIPLEKMMECCREKIADLTGHAKQLIADKMIDENVLKTINAQVDKFKEMIALLTGADERWVALYVPIQTFDRAIDALSTADIVVCSRIEKIKDPRVRRLILREFKAIENFKDLEDTVYDYYLELKEKGDPAVEEKLILEIQSLAGVYYGQLLESCTRKEKYILYDIALNMLVNSNNLETQKVLYRKGMIVCNGTCRLMNESFRNFILTAVDPAEAEHFIRELNAPGKWTSYKTPLMFIILGLVVFLALQENLLSNVNAILTTVIGGLALLTKLSGFISDFSFGKKK